MVLQPAEVAAAAVGCVALEARAPHKPFSAGGLCGEHDEAAGYVGFSAEAPGCSDAVPVEGLGHAAGPCGWRCGVVCD